MAETLLSSLGFPTISKDEALRNRQLEQTLIFNKLISEQAANVAPVERGVFNAFANMSRALSGRGNAELDEATLQKYAIMEKANEKLRTLQTTDEFQKADPSTRSRMSKKALADSALEAGDVMTYTELSTKIFEEELAGRKAQLEMDKLKAQTGASNAAADASRARTASTAQDMYDDAYIMLNPDGTMDMSDSPTIKFGGLDPNTGMFQFTDGTSSPPQGVVPKDMWLRLKELRSKETAASIRAGGDGSGALSNLKKVVGTSEMGKYRQSAAGAAGIARLSTEVFNQFQQFLGKGGDVESIVGTSGSVLGFVGNLASTVKGLTSSFAGTLQRGGQINVDGTRNADGTYNGGEWKTLQQYAEENKNLIALPASIEEDSIEAQKYRSSMMELFYASALALEPGSRALSDQDIKNQIESLGGASGNPISIVEGLLRNSRQKYASLETSRAQMASVGSDPLIGLNKATIDRVVFGIGDGSDIVTAMSTLDEVGNNLLTRLRGKPAPVVNTEADAELNSNDRAARLAAAKKRAEERRAAAARGAK